MTKSKERTRRPTLEELDKLLNYFCEMRDRRKQQIDMVRIIVFALFSTRRQEEITRIRWDAMDEPGRRVLITDMKNPGQKQGNDVWCLVPGEAWSILQSMPRVADEVFPTTPSQCLPRLHEPATSLRFRICAFTTCAMTACRVF